MPIATATINAIVAAIKIALVLQERISYVVERHQRLRDFLQDIKTLESNLRTLQATLEYVENWETRFGHQQRVRETIAKSVDVLKSICGDFTATLQDCHRFLKSGQTGILGAAFGTAEQRILRLRARLQFHSLKIAAAITPLELQLELAFREWLHKPLAEIVDSLASIPQKTAQLLVAQQNQTAELETTPVSYDSEILRECNLRFERETSHLGLELLTLERVLGCFLQHLVQSTVSLQDSVLRTEQNVSALQFINLLKCEWLIDYAKGSRFIERQDSLSYWSLLLTEQESKVQKQFARFEEQSMSKRIYAPALEQVEALLKEVFQLWIFDEVLDSAPDQLGGNTILSYSLREPRTGDRHVSIVQTEPHILRLDDVRRAPTNVEYRNESYLDLRVLKLDPVYASVEQTKVYNVIYRISDSELRSLTFPSLQSMLHFQHATTGYEVIDQPRVAIELHIHRGVFKAAQKVTGTGRLQLWSPCAVENKYVDSHGVLRSAKDPAGAGEAASPRRSSTNSSYFALSGKSSGPSQRALETATIVPQGVPTVNAFLHKKPKKPLLVLILNRDNASQWFKDAPRTDTASVCIAIEIDDKTCLDPEACACKKYPERCKVAMIAHQQNRPLIGYRSVGGGSPGMSLSTLGAYQFDDALQDGRIERIVNLAWASITFPSASDRILFTGSACSSACTKTSKQSSSSRCNQHRGSFRTVRRDYLEELNAYNNRLNPLSYITPSRAPMTAPIPDVTEDGEPGPVSLHSNDETTDTLDKRIADDLGNVLGRMPLTGRISVHIEAHHHIFAYVDRNMGRGGSLRDVLTVTGRPMRCAAMSCGEYVAQRWGDRGTTLLRTMQQLFLEGDEELHLIFDDTATQVRNSPQLTMTRDRRTAPTSSLRVHGEINITSSKEQANTMIIITQFLAWICNVLYMPNSPKAEQGHKAIASLTLGERAAATAERTDMLPSSCYVQYSRWLGSDADLNQQKVSVDLLVRAEGYDKPMLSGKPCWIPLLPGIPLASSTIPERTFGIGIELPFNLMLRMFGAGKAWYNGATICIRSIWATLVLVNISKDSKTGKQRALQWHLYCNDDLDDDIAPTHPESISAGVGNISLEQKIDVPLTASPDLTEKLGDLTDLSWIPQCRQFLGYCSTAKIVLGTSDASYGMQYTSLGQSNGVTASLRSITFGAGYGGFVNVEGEINITPYRSVLSASTPTTYDQMLLRAKTRVVLIYDTSTERACLIPFINLLLHMVVISATKDNLALPPIESSTPGTREAAVQFLMRNRQHVLIPSEDHLEALVSRLYLTATMCIEQRRVERDLRRPWRTGILHGWELMDVIKNNDEILRKENPFERGLLRNHLPTWLPLCAEIGVFVCSRLGDVIQPAANANAICNGWMRRLTQEKHLLLASTVCIKDLAERKGSYDPPIRLGQKAYWKPIGNHTTLFTSCTHSGLSCSKHMQQIDSAGSLVRVPLPVDGAIVFGAS